MKFNEVLDQYEIPYKRHGEHHHTTANRINFDCPYCSKDSGKYRMGYHLIHNYINCWVCGTVHSIHNVLSELTGCTIKEAYNLLGNLEKRRQLKEAHKYKLELPKGLIPLADSHKSYLEKRGLDPSELVRLWDVRGIGHLSKIPWRIFIPIHHHNQIVSWTTRSLSNTVKAKYITARPEQSSVNPKSLLFGEDYARHAIIIVEGPFDVFRIGPGAVATLGISYTQTQLARMSRYPIRVVCFDNETKAQRKAEQLCKSLKMFPGKTIQVILDSKDPASASDKEIKRLRRLLK